MPKWSHCLECEFQVRKDAIKLTRSQGFPLGRALWTVYRNEQHRMEHWVTLITIANASSAASSTPALTSRVNRLEQQARVLFDGTNGISLNSRTRIRDQERAPIDSDLKCSMRGKASRGLRTFAQTGSYFSSRLALVGLPCERRRHRIREGVASASYCGSRVASAVGIVAQYLSGARAESWHMLVADDYHLETGGEAHRPALTVFFVLCAVAGVLLSWNKTAGGETSSHG